MAPEKWIPAFGRGHAPGSEEAANVRVDQELPPRNPAGPCRYSSITVRRDLGGVVSYPRLRLFDRRGLRGTFLRQNPGLRLFALLQPNHEHVRTAHGRVRRSRSCAFDSNRYGGGNHSADGAGEGRRSFGGREGVVRRLPLGDRGMAATLRRNLDIGQRHGSRRMGKGSSEKYQGILSGITDQPNP